MGAITAAVIGAGTAIYSTTQAKKQQKDAQKAQSQQMEALDPYAQYRPGAAERLDALSKDPSSIQDAAPYKARMQAAERTIASQGYTGSGNALVAAAEAGAAAYQQEFDNLAMLSGASQGQGARASAYGTGANAIGNAGDSYLSGVAGVGNNLANLATVWRGRVNTPTSSTSAGSLTGFGNNVGNFTSGNWGG